MNIVGLNSSAGFPLLIGFAGAGYPYDTASSQGKAFGMTDYAPLTNTTACTCGNLSVANYVCTLYFNQSINGSDCFNVQAQNVTIECNGLSITGDDSNNTYGIFSNQFNTTIENCNISNFATGIYFNGADNGTISNTSASTTYPAAGNDGYGIYLDGYCRDPYVLLIGDIGNVRTSRLVNVKIKLPSCSLARTICERCLG